MDTSIPVSELMTRQVVHIEPDTSIDALHRLFEQHHFHHIPVLEHGKLVGIVSKTDYLKVRHVLAITWEGLTVVQDIYKDMTAADIMTREPLKVESSDSIGLAADIFRANTLHALPVVDDGELVGIITPHDLLNHAFQGLL
jgi:CBS domain-containing protein